MSKRRKRKCLNCKQLFRPDPRNLRHQRYCTGDACRRASKTASQRRWLNKAENRDYFCGPDQLARVQHWRRQHPGYARRGTRKENALQDDSSSQVVDKHKETATLMPSACKHSVEVWNMSCVVFIDAGYAANLYVGVG